MFSDSTQLFTEELLIIVVRTADLLKVCGQCFCYISGRCNGDPLHFQVGLCVLAVLARHLGNSAPDL